MSGFDSYFYLSRPNSEQIFVSDHARDQLGEQNKE